jgi:hypothetical protein
MQGSMFRNAMIRQVLLAASLLLASPDRAVAGQPFATELGGSGPDGARTVNVIVDRPALLAELPALQEQGALSEDISADEVAKHPASYANALALLLTSRAVHDLYSDNPDIGVTQWMVAADGIHGAREMFSFSFDRPTYERFPWDRIAFTDFPKAAPGFSYNLRFTLELSRELEGSIADD